MFVKPRPFFKIFKAATLQHLSHLLGLVLSLSFTLLSGCVGGGGDGSSATLSSGSLKMSLEKTSGDLQVTTPNTSWGQPLVVRVTSEGSPLASIPVLFMNASTALATLTTEIAMTDANGYARTSAVSPNVSNASVSIKASLSDGTAQTFTLETRSYPDTPTITLKDPVTLSTSYAQQTTIGVSILDVSTAVKWCLSETQTSRPATGSSQCNGGAGAFNGWSIVKPTSFTLSAVNGAKTLYIWVADQFDQLSLNPSNASIFLDTVVPGTPTVSLTDTGSGSTTDTSSSIVNLNISNDGDASFWCVITQLSVDPVPVAPTRNQGCWTQVKPSTVTMANLGLNQTYVWTKDLAGNVSATYGSQYINYTTVTIADPTFTLSDTTTASSSYARARSVNIAISGDATASKWCVSETQTTRPVNSLATCQGGAGPQSGWYSARPTTFNLSAGEGSKTVYVWLANPLLNTNSNAVSRTITLDTVAPSIPLADLFDPNTNLPNFTNQTNVTLQITGDTDAVAWCVYEKASAAIPPSLPAYNDACWSGVRPSTVTLGATGLRRVYVYTKDVASNVSPAPGVGSINYTTTPPASPLGVLKDLTTGSTTLANAMSVDLTISAPTGTVRWCVSETQPTAPATGTATCNGGTGPSSGWFTSSPTSFSLSPADGLKTVYLWVADGANNVNSVVATATITLDRTNPATPTVVAKDPNSNSTTSTNQIIPTLQITNDTDAARWCRIVQDAALPAPAKPGLSDSCWVLSRPTNFILDQTGPRSVYVFTRDLAGNIGSAGFATIEYNTDFAMDPTVVLADAVTSLTGFAKQASVQLTITNDTDATRWCVSETQTSRPTLGTATCNGGSGPSNGWFTVKPTSFTLSNGEGSKRVYVWAANIFNTVNGSPSSAVIVRDQTLPSTPVIALADPNSGSTTDTNSSSVNLSISGEDADVTAWCTIEQASAAAAPTTPLFSNACWQTTKPVIQNLSATGSRKVYAYFRDRADNVSAVAGVAQINFSTSNPAVPSISLSDATTGSSLYVRQPSTAVSITGDTGAVKWCLSETQATKPALGTANCMGGSGASNGWLTAKPTNFVFSNGDGVKTVYLWTADVANNTSLTAATAAITLDTLAPQVPIINLADPNTGNTSFTNQSSVNLSISGDADATAWCVIEQAFATAAPTNPLFSNACWVTVRPTTVSLGAQGNRRVYLFTRDVAKNVSAVAATTSIIYSTAAPTDPLLSLSNLVTGSKLYTNDRNVGVSISNPPGAVKWCISQSQSTKPANGTSACVGGSGPDSGWYSAMPSTFQLSSGDALKTVYIWVADNSNNTNTNVSSTTITLIENALAAPTVSLTDPNTGSSATTNQGTVSMAITNDTGATAWCGIAQDAAAGAPTPPLSSDTCWNLTRPTSISLGAVGSRKVYVYLRDPAMNISAAGSATINLSTTSPADPTLAMVHAVTGLSTYAKTQALTLTIANDASAVRWCVSETQSVKPNLGTSTCTGGVGPSNGWFTARPTSFTLSAGDGTKRVYVWVANAANNVNDNSVSQTIILDTTAPGTFLILGMTGGSDVTADNYLGTTLVPTGNWNASSGSNSYDVVIKDAAGTSVVCALQSTAATVFNFSGCNLVDGVSYKFYVTAYDVALNGTPATNNGFTFTVSLTPPGAFTIAGLTGASDSTADQYAGSSLPTVSWTAATNVDHYTVRILANDGVTTLCPLQVKASGVLSHDYSTTGCSALADNTLYQAEVTAVDVAGNVRTATNSPFVFRTDLSAPTINITGSPAAQSILSTANFTFAGTDSVSGVVSVQCKLDAGSYAACDSFTTQSLVGLADGSHTFTVRAVDRVGLSGSASFTWSIDTVAPTAFTITGATGATDTLADNQLRNDTLVTANWTTSATADSYEVTILNSDDSVLCPMVTKAAGSTSHSFSSCPVANPGSFKIKVVAKRGYGTSYAPTPMVITAVKDSVTATITTSAASISSGGFATITLVGYQNGTQMNADLLTPSFSIASGTSTGTFSNITYIGSGTYTAKFTGVLMGTAASITASTSYFGGFTGVTPTSVQVTVGGVSAATSTVSLSKVSVRSDNIDKATVTVQVRDAAGNAVTGATLAGTTTGGTSTGSFSAFTESPAGSGNYTSDFMGLIASGSTNIRITANGTILTAQPTILVLAGAPTKIKVTGPTSLTTHSCSAAYAVTLRDYNDNIAQATNNVQINFSGLTTGNFSLSSTCSTTDNNTTITLGGGTAANIYIMPRGVSTSSTISFSDNAGSLTAATINVSIAGTLSWIGQTGAFNWGTLAGIPARSTMSGFVEPRGVWVNPTSKTLFVADTYNNRIVRYDAQGKTMTGWIGVTESISGIDCPGFVNPTVAGNPTPGWCTGGSSPRTAVTTPTNWDGILNLPSAITGDGTYLYVVDYGNHRIVRYKESDGTFQGWYGRISAANLPSSCATGTPAASTATPDWCFGGNSTAYTTAPANTTNWDGVFSFTSIGTTTLSVFADPNTSSPVKTYLIINDTNSNRIIRTRITSTRIIWEGWAGRTNSVSGMTNGTNTTGCDTLTSGFATPGWCLGGTSQASPQNNSNNGTCTGPANCASSALVYTSYDNMFNSPRGLALVPGATNLAYFADQNNSRWIKFNLDTGKTAGWAGRMVRDAGYQGTGGTNCTSTLGTLDTGWCVGGVPLFINYQYYTGTGTSFNPGNNNNVAYYPQRTRTMDTDGTYIYAMINDERIIRFDPTASTIATTTAWVGRVASQPTSGISANGCTATPIGFATPGWCLGGGSQSGSFEGQFSTGWAISVDAVNGALYAADVTNSKVQAYNLSTGASTGWIGARTYSTTSWSTSFIESLFGYIGFNNQDGAIGSGSITISNTNAYGVATGASGLTKVGNYLFVLDTANNRIKRHLASTGAFTGWFGKASAIPTGLSDACTTIGAGGLTPDWCYGGVPAGLQYLQSSINDGGGEMRTPQGLAGDSSYLYVSDTLKNRILRIDATTAAFVGWLGRTGTTPAGMSGFDTAGNTQCASLGSSVYTDAFCVGGNHSAANTDGALNTPKGLAVDAANNRLFVADYANHRISMYSTANDSPSTGSRAGRFLGWIGRSNGTNASGSAGPTTGAANTTCTTLTNALSTPNWCLGAGGNTSTGASSALTFMGFTNPSAVAYDNNAIYVTDTGANRIQKFNATTGAHLGWIGKAAASGSTPLGEGTGSGLATGACTIALGATTPGWCYRGFSQAGTSDNTFNAPTGIWVDPDTNYFYVVDAGNHRITKHNKVSGAFVGWRGVVGSTVPTGGGTSCTTLTQGQVTPTWCTGGTSQIGTALGGFYNPISITGDTSFIYITDTYNSRVVSIPK